MKTGIKIDYKNPDDETQLLHAQFATARTNPEMNDLMLECARKDVSENAALKRLELALEKLQAATDEETLLAAEKLVQDASDKRHAASAALVDAIHAFVVRGFELGGSSPETAELLASITPPERLQELKAACLFGSGSLDFTRKPGDARS